MRSGIGIESRLDLPEDFRYQRVVKKAKDYRAGDRRVVAHLRGPGCIRHLYCVGSRSSYRNHDSRNRGFILRLYWDDEDEPSVEVPLGDFFGIHHNVSYYPIDSFYTSAKADAGLGCYFPMPFRRSARFEVEALVDGFFTFTLDWHKYLTERFDEPLRFHASWRRENPAPAWGENFLVMDALGRGYLAGFSLGVRVRTDDQRWSHAGSENLYIDGEGTGDGGVVPHYLRAGGGENSFDAGFGGVVHEPDSCRSSGIPFLQYYDAGPALPRLALSAYRFYVHDLLPFRESVHFRWGSQANDMCATAYWYQTEPHRRFVRMAPYNYLRYGNWMNEIEVPSGAHDLLRPVGASDTGAIPASVHDGSWSLTAGREALDDPATPPGSTVRYEAFHGFVDFAHVFSTRSDASNETWPSDATAGAVLEVDRKQAATIHLSWSGKLELRLNDEEVRRIGCQATYGYQPVEVTLRSGRNTLFIYLENASDRSSWGAFAFSCRVVCDGGTVVVPQATE